MKEKKQSAILGRRNFLKAAGATVGAAGIATVALTGAPTKSVAETKRKGAGYRETEHVRRVYALARF